MTRSARAPTRGSCCLNWQDVLAFLEQRLPEGSRLDYKGELPANIEKHLAAFANTQGGLLLIGVDQDAAAGAPEAPPSARSARAHGTGTGTRPEARSGAAARQGISTCEPA
jgi:predicted HTH transcriptional regulator